MKIDPQWYRADGNCSCLIIEGGDPRKIRDRYAFIEKTPRVRMSKMPEAVYSFSDSKNWFERDFKGSGANDEISKAWCVEALTALGHILTNVPDEEI